VSALPLHRPPPEVDRLLEALAAGERRALSRALSWIESGHRDAAALLARVYPRAGVPWVLGVTGVGGAGKSTLVPLLARRLVAEGARVGILAVDPSSPVSGGALLGDRIRDTADPLPQLFYRSVATRGGHGALAECISDLIRVLSLGGFDTVIVETVGAGQSEVEIMALAHSVLLVCAPGLGDEVQAIKAGVMEIAHVIAVNKADLPGAQSTAETLRHALGLPVRAHGLKAGVNALSDGSARWHAPVLLTQGTGGVEGVSMAELAATLRDHLDHCRASGGFDALDRARDFRRVEVLFEQHVLQRARAQARAAWPEVEQALAQRQTDPWSAAAAAADRILPKLLQSTSQDEETR